MRVLLPRLTSRHVLAALVWLPLAGSTFSLLPFPRYVVFRGPRVVLFYVFLAALGTVARHARSDTLAGWACALGFLVGAPMCLHDLSYAGRLREMYQLASVAFPACESGASLPEAEVYRRAGLAYDERTPVSFHCASAGEPAQVSMAFGWFHQLVVTPRGDIRFIP